MKLYVAQNQSYILTDYSASVWGTMMINERENKKVRTGRGSNWGKRRLLPKLVKNIISVFYLKEPKFYTLDFEK